ncbi:MAG TPA: AI-2E family transporter [Candidatus Eisenbacteria bacterium]|nr:AI-2E family transporter [Candidatus Eisenbacteria bacterium]
MSFQLTPRERRWFDVALVLATIVLAFVALGFIGAVLSFFSDLILVFFLAWLMAFILSPIVSRLRSTIPFLSRAGAVFTVYFILFGSLVIVSVVLASALVGSIGDFIANVPRLREDLPSALAPWQDRLDSLGLIQIDLVTQADQFLDNLSRYATELAVPLQQVAVASIGAIGNLLLVIVFSLYMVADRDRLVAFLFRLVPPGYKQEALVLEEAVARSFGGFLRGQALTGIVFAGISAIATIVFGLDFGAITTVLAGLLMAIPFFGPFVAWIPPVLVAVLSKPDATLGTVVVIAIGWFLVMNALQPRIMADALRIHPIVVLASVFVGLKLAGVGGAVFGIPIAAVLSALFLHSLGRPQDQGPVAARAARRVGEREGRVVHAPREPDPAIDRDIETPATTARPAADVGIPEAADVAISEAPAREG